MRKNAENNSIIVPFKRHRLGTLEENFGKTLQTQAPFKFNLEYLAARGVFDFETFPSLSIDQCVNAQIAVGVVEFEEDLMLVKWNFHLVLVVVIVVICPTVFAAAVLVLVGLLFRSAAGSYPQ